MANPMQIRSSGSKGFSYFRGRGCSRWPGPSGAHPACGKKVGQLAGAAVPTERQAGARARLHGRLMVAAPTSVLLGQGPTLDAGCLGLAVLDILFFLFLINRNICLFFQIPYYPNFSQFVNYKLHYLCYHL